MAAQIDFNVVGKEFDRWLDWNGQAEESNEHFSQPSGLMTASGLPISPISTANSDSFSNHQNTPYTAPHMNDLPTPSNSSGSPETPFNPYRLSGDTLRSESSFMNKQPTLKRKLSPNDGSEHDFKPVVGRPTGSKRPHNVIEKRYRANLNEKIAELRDSVPALRMLKKTKGKPGKEAASSDEEDLEGLTPSNKLNKASILTKAVEYIRHLEFRTKKLEEENRALKERISVLDKVFEEGGDNAARTSAFTSEDTIEKSSESQSPSQSSESDSQSKIQPEGLIGLPESMRRLREEQPQEHYGHVYSTPRERSKLSGKWPQRIMLGSIAGLLVVEGFGESDIGDTSQKKALFGIPIEILDGWKFLSSPRLYLSMFSEYCRSGGVLPLVKGFFALTILAFLVFYYMFNSKPNNEEKQQSDLNTLPEATRPALPVEVRRRAWSTSMQALGLPHHSFFPEWFAVTSEWINYSIRYLLGPSACLWLCGETEEDEVARIKAWDIAIDAQLAGGDVEVSRSRAVLTIIGSGTLPATPLRLMMKAIHVRIVLHNIAIAGSLSSKVASTIAYFISNRQWRRARQYHELLPARSSDRLPGYLNYLLQMDCEDVFTKIITQRALNLMYDRPTSEYAEDSLMDVVVEDHAIKSSLDAIAAWRSISALQDALTTALQSPDAADLLREHIQAALEIAPPGSAAETRALAVHAVLSPGRRHGFYLRAADALNPSVSTGHGNFRDDKIPYFIDSSTPMSARPEITTVLACAEAMLKVEQEQNLSGAIDIFADMEWPDLGMDNSGGFLTPTMLSIAPIYFVLTRLLRASRRESGCSSSDCEDNVHPLPQLTSLARNVYQNLRFESVRLGLNDGDKTHLSSAIDKIFISWDLRSNAISRRQSCASHDTGYVSQEDDDIKFEENNKTSAKAFERVTYGVSNVDALAVSV